MQDILTLEALKEMSPSQIFFRGEMFARRWVACRGDIHD